MIHPQGKNQLIALPSFLILLVLFVLFSSARLAAQSQDTNPATASAASAELSAEKPGNCSVQGIVVAAAGGQPVRGARVLLSNLEAGQFHTYSGTTDAEGRFLITGVPEGRYRFQASKNSFVTQSYRPDGGGEAILELVSGQKLEKVQFRLSRAAVIAGRITDEEGEPVVGAQVQALKQAPKAANGGFGGLKGQWLPVKTATTNDLGEYRLFGLQPGSYYLAAVDSGMPELGEVFNFTSAASAVSLDVTDSDDTLSFQSILGGAEQASAHPTIYYPGVTVRSQAEKIRLSAGDETRIDLSLRPEKTVTVSGIVLDLNGKPAAQVPVNVRSQNVENALSSLRTSAITDALGKFAIKGVMPGSYSVLAFQQEHEGHARSAEQPIEVGSENVTGVQLRLTGGLNLSGRLTAKAGENIDLTTIQIFLSGVDGFERTGVAQVKKDGTFTFSGLQPSVYNLFLGGLPEGWYLNSANLGGDSVLDNGLRLSESANAYTLEVGIREGTGQIEGLVSKGDAPAPGAEVRLLPQPAASHRQDLMRRAMTDQRGHFVMKDVVPGSYRAVVLSNENASEDDEDAAVNADSADSGESVAVAEKESKTLQLKLKTPAQ